MDEISKTKGSHKPTRFESNPERVPRSITSRDQLINIYYGVLYLNREHYDKCLAILRSYDIALKTFNVIGCELHLSVEAISDENNFSCTTGNNKNIKQGT